MSHFIPLARYLSVASSIVSGEISPPEPLSSALALSLPIRGVILASNIANIALSNLNILLNR